MLNIPTSQSRTVYDPPAGDVRRPLLTPLPTPGEFLLVIDNSSLEKWKRCPKAAYYYLVLGREAHARNAALTFGGAVHVGLEKLLRGEPDEIQVTSIIKHFTENPTPPDEYRTVETAVSVLGHYRQRASFPDFAWEILADTNGLIIERAFELPLGVLEVEIELPDFGRIDKIHVAWSGRIDVVATVNGRNRICDHKTSSISGDQFVQSFQLSSQTVGYVWAARQLWPELDVTGFCLNAIHLKKPGKGQGLMDRGARGGEPPLSFARYYFDYATARMDEWANDTLTHIEDFVHCLSRGVFPMNDRQCFDKFGQCPYFPVDIIDDPVVRERFINSEQFKEVTWNPTHDR